MLLRLTVHIYKTPEPISAIIRHASKSFYSFYKVFVCIIQIFEYFRDRTFESYFSNESQPWRMHCALCVVFRKVKIACFT